MSDPSLLPCLSSFCQELDHRKSAIDNPVEVALAPHAADTAMPAMEPAWKQVVPASQLKRRQIPITEVVKDPRQYDPIPNSKQAAVAQDRRRGIPIANIFSASFCASASAALRSASASDWCLE